MKVYKNGGFLIVKGAEKLSRIPQQQTQQYDNHPRVRSLHSHYSPKGQTETPEDHAYHQEHEKGGSR